ncbi:uncharacterized protein LOC141617153 [Silene latifolia]|uniref:uncharacterized protein LOC141617153 n=1 Tax=Silene latifolia TaxID=37657 RepID=UPI003D77ED88
MHSINDSVKNSVSYTEDARELWLDLEERFCVVDGSRIHALKAKLHDCRQTKGMTVTTYFGELKVLWDAISNYEPPFACKCGGCKCNISKTAMARQDSERVHKFLMGLDATLYKTIRSQQLALDPLPSLNRVYHSVLQKERLVSSPTAVEEPMDIMAFTVRSDSSTPVTTGSIPDWRALRDAERQERRKLFCSHCQANGHEAISCFIRSQRFPNWWGGSTSVPSSDRLSGMSPTWIIDTGASHHVTGDATWLADPHPIPLYPVTLPNGQSVSASIAGTGDKFAKRSRKCLFIGYPQNKKGWKVFDLATREIFISRDVYFYENSFPYITDTHTFSSPNSVPNCDYGPLTSPDPCDPTDSTEPSHNDTGSGADSSTTSSTPSDTGPTIDASGPPSGSDSVNSHAANDNTFSPVEMGRGKRHKIPSTRLHGYVVGTACTSSDSDSPHDSPRSSGTPYALANYVSCNKFSSKHRAFLEAITTGVESPTFRAALADPRWCKAMADEIAALENNATWELSTLPPGKKVEGIDYGETFAPVVKMVTIRAFLDVAAVKNWELHQMDVHNAFLHGDLDKEVYKKLPPGFGNGKEGKVCRLRKSLYGLRQAPRCWFAKLGTALRRYGFTQFYSDYSLFSYTQNTTSLHVLVYVDDLVVAGNDSLAISKFKKYLGDCFHMKDLGVLKYFLGIEVARNSKEIFLSQRKYALDIISETGLLGSKPVATPIEQNHTLGLATGEFLEDIDVARDKASCFVLIVSSLSQAGVTPTGAVIPLLDDRFSGWLVFLGASPISWKTKKQQTVSLSSVEAEYRAMATLLCELKWVKGLLLSLGVSFASPMNVYSDSQSAIQLAQNPVFHERTKHIEIDCHFIRDAITDRLIRPSHVSTKGQIADIFTKALTSSQFVFLLRKLGILNLHTPV